MVSMRTLHTIGVNILRKRCKCFESGTRMITSDVLLLAGSKLLSFDPVMDKIVGEAELPQGKFQDVLC